jgi:hypothetical protein
MHWCGVVAKIKHKIYPLGLLRVPSERVTPSGLDVRSPALYCTYDLYKLFLHEVVRIFDAVLDVKCFLVCKNLLNDA